ncbi:MAG: serine/threonine protein kinase [Deltaproteobacteria bacterium]|nr:serine/threonine protein kinase [Deltaproteobacteria bacterium]
MANNPRKLTAGASLGRFRIVKRLGRGATATVYLAEDVTTGAAVALKALHADLHATGSHAALRMRREIELVHRIDHPGICRIFDLHTEDRLLFLTMQFIAGDTLDAVLKRDRRLTIARAARVLSAICRALAAAHAKDILHRDLKPSNIMLAPNDAPMILDFGYATGPDVGRLTATGEWVGTLYYAAPELLKNGPNTRRSDIYSLGVILYQAVTGELPFQGNHPGEIAEALLFRDPIPPSALSPVVSASLEAVILKAMRRTPAERYADVLELADALTPFDLAPRTPGALELGATPKDGAPALAAPDDDTEPRHRGPRPETWSDSGPATPTAATAYPLREAPAPEPTTILKPEPAPAAPVAPRPTASPTTTTKEAPPPPAPESAPTKKRPKARVRYVPPQGGGFALDTGVRAPGRAAPKPGAKAATPRPSPAAAPAPAATPVAAKPATNDTTRRGFEAQRTALLAIKEERGLRGGDNLTLDSLERMAAIEHQRGRLAEACQYAELAIAEANNTVVDAVFVGAKIQRFDKLMRRVGGLKTVDRVAAALDKVMLAFEKREFTAANQALNEALEALEK